MKVPFLDIHACFDPLRGDIFRELEGVFDRCDFVLGKPVRDLEEAVRQYAGAKYAIGCASGTDALIIALRAAGVGPGMEVVTTPFSFIATAESVYVAGARPVFCDISPATYNLDPAKVLKFIEKKCEVWDGALTDLSTSLPVKALLPVHLYGLMADLNAFGEIARRFNLKLIEDAAQAFGAEMQLAGGAQGKCGAVGDAGCLSFYPSKNLGGAGDGGMILTNDPGIFELADILHIHGGKQKYYHTHFGYNSRLDSIQAAILLVKLKQVDKWLEMRRNNAALYTKLFKEKLGAAGVEVIESKDAPADGSRPENAVILPSEPDGFRHTYNSYEIRLPRRDEAQKHLTEKNIGCGIYYPLPLHLQKIFDYLGLRKGDLPVTEAICADILAVPQYPELPPDAIEYVVDTVVGFLRE